jgi:acetolactate synthase-1/2/3 large subunit
MTQEKASQMAKLTGARYIAEFFKAYGVTHYFFMPVSIHRAVKEMGRLDIIAIAAHSEKAAAYMADGYARVSGRVGVCGAQAIGATNLAAGLRDALMARIPLVALTGGKYADTRYMLSYQEIDDMPIFEALTKFNAVVDDPSRLPDLLRTAFRAATTGTPKPVHLELSGISGEAVTGEFEGELQFEPRFGRFPAIRTPGPEDDVRAALSAMSKAKRPIIVAGGGVLTSSAVAELAELARKLSTPVATSLNAKSTMLDDDPLSVGVVGEYSRSTANMAVSEADLVVFVGSLTGSLITRSWTVPKPGVKVVHVDIDPENIGRNYADSIGVCGDARTVLRQMIKLAEPAAGATAWLERIASLKREWSQIANDQETSSRTPIAPQRVAHEICRQLPEDAIVVGDTGHAGAWVAQNFYTTSPRQRFIRAHGSLGWAFPASIGAKCAAPDRPVICFTGDGGIYYHIAELETMLRHELKVTVVVNNNASLNQEAPLWRKGGALEKHWRMSPTNFAKVAEGFGCRGVRVERPDEIAPAIAEALAAPGPVLLDVVTDPACMAAPSWAPAGSRGMYPLMAGD